MTRYLVEDGFTTGTARSFVTKLLAMVVSALEEPPTHSCTDMLCFEAVVEQARCCIQRSLFPLYSLPLDSLAFSWAAALITSMTSAA